MSNIQTFLDALTTEELAERLDLALEGTGLGIWDWDLRDDSVHFDRRWCEMLGLRHDTTPMHLTTWSDRVHPDDLAGCYADVGAHLEGRTDRYENTHRMRHADGRWVWILDRGRISGRGEDGRPIRFTGTHLDVTEQVEARQAVERHRHQLQQLVAHLPVSVAIYNSGGLLVARSPHWPSDAPSDSPFAGLDFEGAPPLADVRAALGGQPRHADEQKVEGRDGIRFVRWSCLPLTAGHDGDAGVQVTWRDITDDVMRRRREAEAEESRVAALALFAAGVAHELNSPLQVILMESQMLLREATAGPVPPDDVRHYAESLSAVATLASRTTRALRALARDASADPPAPVALADIWQHVQALCASQARVAGVRLEFAPTEQVVWGREAQLVHLMLNLVSNALDAVEGSADPWVRLEALPSDPACGDATIAVRCIDNGPGVAPRHADELFRPWFTTKPPGRGTGLGLAVARRLAESNDGSLTLEVSAHPTTFRVCLPTADAP